MFDKYGKKYYKIELILAMRDSQVILFILKRWVFSKSTYIKWVNHINQFNLNH